jgi:hypothetical protein
MLVWSEEVPVVFGYSESGVSAVDHAEQRLELGIEGVARSRELAPLVEQPRDLEPVRRDRVAPVVSIVDREKPTRLGEQAEENAVKKHQRIRERVAKRAGAPRLVGEEAGRDRR